MNHNSSAKEVLKSLAKELEGIEVKVGDSSVDRKTKVYCKNCKYKGHYTDWQWCEFRGDKVKSPYTGQVSIVKNVITGPMFKNELNSDGQCKYYQKAKWRFWVKDNN